MAKPIECITEFNEEEAREFLKIFNKAKRNPAREKIIADAMAQSEIFERVQ